VAVVTEPVVKPWDDAQVERVRLQQERLWNMLAWAERRPEFGTVKRAQIVAAFGVSKLPR
jgi:hypothetical protein